MTKLCISFVEVTGKGGSVIKENPQQAFPVVVVVWISIAVLPVKINNAKNDYSYVKTNQKSGNENSVSWLSHPRAREIWPRTSAHDILHSPKQPLCSALHSKMSIQKGTSEWQGREWNIRVHCVIANSGAEKNDPSAPTYCWERQKVPRSTVGHPITITKVHTVSWKSPDHGIQTWPPRKKMGFNQEKVNTHTCASFLKDAKMHWHWQIKMSKL